MSSQAASDPAPALRDYLAAIGRKGGQVSSDAKRLACVRNAKVRWKAVRARKKAVKQG